MDMGNVEWEQDDDPDFRGWKVSYCVFGLLGCDYSGRFVATAINRQIKCVVIGVYLNEVTDELRRMVRLHGRRKKR